VTPAERVHRRGCCACEHAAPGTPRGTVPQPEIPLPCDRQPGTCTYGLDAALAIDDKQTPIFDEVSEEDGSWRTEASGAWHESSEDFRDRQNNAASIAPYLAVLPHLAGVLSEKQREVVDALLDDRRQADLSRGRGVLRTTTGNHFKRAKTRLGDIFTTLRRESCACAVGRTTLEDGLVSLARVANTMTSHQALVLLEMVAGGHTSWVQLGKRFGLHSYVTSEMVCRVVDRVTAWVGREGIPPTEAAVLESFRCPTDATDLPIKIRRTLATQLAAIYVSRCRIEDAKLPENAAWAGSKIQRLVFEDVARAGDASLAMIDAALPPA